MQAELFDHPLIDACHGKYGIYRSLSSWVTLSSPLALLLAETRRLQARLVLVTKPDAVLSNPLAEELFLANGAWAASDADGTLFDATSGVWIKSLGELWGRAPRDRGRYATFDSVRPDSVGALFFDVYVRHRADEDVRIGSVAQHMVVGLGGGPLDRFGVEEPLVNVWSPDALTGSMRRQMPVTPAHLGAAPDGSSVRMVVARTDRGLVEHTRGFVPTGPYGRLEGMPARARIPSDPRISDTLAEMAEKYSVNMGFVSYVERVDLGKGRLGRYIGARHMDVPLAGLIGPAAVRGLQLDIEALGTRHDIVAVGRRKIPSAVIRFTGADPLWQQLMAFARDLDRELLLNLLGTGEKKGAGSA